MSDKANANQKSGTRLNKYLAQCGIASRRKAAEIVKAGKIKVNGAVQDNPSYMVLRSDKVEYRGKNIKPNKAPIYLLLNKPKDVITTMKDERGRKTVYDLIKERITERIFPVGRLDRMTTGLLVLTNDGDLAQKLAHPKHKVKKIYHVVLHRPLKQEDLDKIAHGIALDDGIALVDKISYVQGRSKKEVGLELHQGKNRIIRRLFEHLGYKVVRLDRTYYAGLTKKDLPRGHYRRLTRREIIMLKHFI